MVNVTLQNQQWHKDILRTLPALHPCANGSVYWFEEVLALMPSSPTCNKIVKNTYFETSATHHSYTNNNSAYNHEHGMP